jgi:hypothetical protein
MACQIDAVLNSAGSGPYFVPQRTESVEGSKVVRQCRHYDSWNWQHDVVETITIYPLGQSAWRERERERERENLVPDFLAMLLLQFEEERTVGGDKATV